jgi:hypothetical protein
MRFFGFKWFGQTKPSRLLINILKYFDFGFKFAETFDFLCILRILSIGYRSAQHIFSVRTAKFSLKIHLIPLSEYVVQILSTYSQYTNRFIPHILNIRSDSFCVFRECAQIIWILEIELFSSHLLKGYYFQKSMCMCNWTEDLQGIIDYLALAWQNNFFPNILIIRGMTFEFEYLGEFELIFEII